MCLYACLWPLIAYIHMNTIKIIKTVHPDQDKTEILCLASGGSFIYAFRYTTDHIKEHIRKCKKLYIGKQLYILEPFKQKWTSVHPDQDKPENIYVEYVENVLWFPRQTVLSSQGLTATPHHNKNFDRSVVSDMFEKFGWAVGETKWLVHGWGGWGLYRDVLRQFWGGLGVKR